MKQKSVVTLKNVVINFTLNCAMERKIGRHDMKKVGKIVGDMKGRAKPTDQASNIKKSWRTSEKSWKENLRDVSFVLRFSEIGNESGVNVILIFTHKLPNCLQL